MIGRAEEHLLTFQTKWLDFLNFFIEARNDVKAERAKANPSSFNVLIYLPHSFPLK